MYRKEIDAREAGKLVNSARYSKPDGYRYADEWGSMCEYVNSDNGKPMCIVGVALETFAGVHIPSYQEIDGEGISLNRINGPIGSVIDYIRQANPDVLITDAAVAVFAAAQGAQDNGGTWNQADAAANRVVDVLARSAIDQ